MNRPIQPVAWDILSREDEPLVVWALPFPASWRATLLQLEQERTGRTRDVQLPIAPLNATLTALCSQIMIVPGYARADADTERGTPAWLVARDSIPPEVISTIVRAWCGKMFANCPNMNTALARILPSDLVWEQTTLHFAAPTAPNDTALPDSLAFRVLPAQLADLLVERKLTVRVHGQERQLRRVPSAIGAELITWPPVGFVDDRNQVWPFSYTVHLSLQTELGLSRPRLHTHYGVRRWVRQPSQGPAKLYLRATKRTVYLLITQEWFALPATMRFTRARLQNVPGEDGQWRLGWGDLLPTITRNLGIAWPSATELLEKADAYLCQPGVNGLVAAVVEHWSRSHPVKAGVDLRDHAQMTQAITAKLDDHLALTQVLTAQEVLRKRKRHPLQENLRLLPADVRLTALAESVGQNVTIEVWWKTDEGRNMQIDRILAILCEPLPKLVEQPATPGVTTIATNSTNDDDDTVREPPEDVEELLADDVEALTGDTVEVDEVVADEVEPDDTIESSLIVPAPPKKPRRREKEPLPQNYTEALEIPISGGRLRILPRPIGAIGAPLPTPAAPIRRRKERGQYKKEQTERRISEIIARVETATEPTLAIIELENYQDPQRPAFRQQMGLRDPKRAIRIGMARQGRITKFQVGNTQPLEPPSGKTITPRAAGRPTEKAITLLRHRCEASVLEGLRQLGYLPEPIGFEFNGQAQLPRDMVVAGLWMLRLTQKRGVVRVHLPIVVLMHTSRRQVRAWIPDGKGTRPFYQALLDIVAMNPETVQRNNQTAALRQLRQFLEQDSFDEGYKDVTLLVDAQNIRMSLTGFQNPYVLRDVWRLDKRDAGIPIDTLRGRMRVIRLRTSDSNETPEWFPIENIQPIQSVQGVWPVSGNDRLFFNIAAKPNTMKGVREGKQVNPDEHYAIASILEVYLATLQEEDKNNLASWAGAIDQWRKMGYLTDGMTLHPMPLQWAQHADRYAQVIGPWVFPREWEEENADVNEDEGDNEQASREQHLSSLDF